MEEAGFVTYTVARHQGAIETFWLHLEELLGHWLELGSSSR